MTCATILAQEGFLSLVRFLVCWPGKVWECRQVVTPIIRFAWENIACDNARPGRVFTILYDYMRVELRSYRYFCVSAWEVINIFCYFVCRPGKLLIGIQSQNIFDSWYSIGSGNVGNQALGGVLVWGDKSELYLGRIVSLGFSVGRDRNDWSLPRSGTEILSYDHKPSWELLGILAANHGHFPNLEENGSHKLLEMLFMSFHIMNHILVW